MLSSFHSPQMSIISIFHQPTHNLYLIHSPPGWNSRCHSFCFYRSYFDQNCSNWIKIVISIETEGLSLFDHQNNWCHGVHYSLILREVELLVRYDKLGSSSYYTRMRSTECYWVHSRNTFSDCCTSIESKPCDAVMQHINKVGSVSRWIRKLCEADWCMKAHRQFADETSFSFPDDVCLARKKAI